MLVDIGVAAMRSARTSVAVILGNYVDEAVRVIIENAPIKRSTYG